MYVCTISGQPDIAQADFLIFWISVLFFVYLFIFIPTNNEINKFKMCHICSDPASAISTVE